MKIKFFLALLYFVIANGAMAQEQCFDSPYELFDELDNVFVKGAFLPIRQVTEDEGVVVGLMVRTGSVNKAFESIGVRGGSTITEICDIPVYELFKSSEKNPFCCKGIENGKISITFSNSSTEKSRAYIDVVKDL
ncbi:hypothetical protein [Marinimicrobium sp. ABcell2]|uniref:hypothetical protein n=1 Tax=Marinimicrobium sp. ABcell2 TaxID=3069751 RepID=UPI0027B77206|nr:hypothetical protein [Marinimicrobium sp. ABcell2]MDQ2076391.1 hypothetical protein [Marinimicrobium sp. ABcell2]